MPGVLPGKGTLLLGTGAAAALALDYQLKDSMYFNEHQITKDGELIGMMAIKYFRDRQNKECNKCRRECYRTEKRCLKKRLQIWRHRCLNALSKISACNDAGIPLSTRQIIYH